MWCWRWAVLLPVLGSNIFIDFFYGLRRKEKNHFHQQFCREKTSSGFSLAGKQAPHFSISHGFMSILQIKKNNNCFPALYCWQKRINRLESHYIWILHHTLLCRLCCRLYTGVWSCLNFSVTPCCLNVGRFHPSAHMVTDTCDVYASQHAITCLYSRFHASGRAAQESAKKEGG